MAKVKVDSLVLGKKLGYDINLPNSNIVWVRRGAEINEKIMEQLKRWGIEEIEIAGEPEKVKPEREVEPFKISRTDDATIIEGDVLGQVLSFDENVKVIGSVSGGAILSSRGNVYIVDKVIDSTVLSEGNLLVIGGVEGTGKAKLEAKEDIKTSYALNSKITSREGSVFIDYEVENCQIEARRRMISGIAEVILEIDEQHKSMRKGWIKSGIIEVGSELEANRIGSMDRKKTEISVSSFRLKEIALKKINLSKNLNETLSKVKELNRIIELVKVLGDKVSTLSPEKKAEIKGKSDLYFKLKNDAVKIVEQLRLLETEKQREIENANKPKVKVKEEIYPGVIVSIDNSSLEVKYKSKNVGFYKKGILIMGNLDRV